MARNFTLDMHPMGKARPRVTRTGHAFMPTAYRKWKAEFVARCMALPLKDRKTIDGPVSITVLFYTKTGNMRSDCDNAYAAVLDGLQDAKIIANDRQVKCGCFTLFDGPKDCIGIIIEEKNANR